MNKKMIFSTLMLSLLMLMSCGKDNPQEKQGDTDGKEPPRRSSSEYDFPYTALKQGIEFIDNLLLLNNKIDKTAIYDKENDFNKYYTKKITMPGGGKVSIESWTAASPDLFVKKTDLRNKAKSNFLSKIDELIGLRQKLLTKQVKAEEGVAGYTGNYEVDDSRRYVDEKGIELAEATEKQIMGIVLLDQILNNHLGDFVMKNKDLRDKNTKRVFISGRKYTELEYHWDIAFALLGTDNRDQKPKFIANYILNEFQGADFLKDIDSRVYDAFKEGREALGKGNYKKVDESIAQIRESLSLLFAGRTVHYLKKAKPDLKALTSDEYHMAFHPLSEAYGFIPAFIATRKANGEFYIADYTIIEKLLKDFEGQKGFWEKDRLLADDNTIGSLDNIAKRIGEIYGFDYKKIQ